MADQGGLFDLDALTVAAPDKEIRDALVQQGDTAVGRRKIFEAATIRQITLAYGWEEHRAIMARLDAVLTQTKSKNPSEALVHLLTYWEAGHAVRSSVPAAHVRAGV